MKLGLRAGRIVMAIGVIAEVYAYGPAGNEANIRSEDELDLGENGYIIRSIPAGCLSVFTGTP